MISQIISVSLMREQVPLTMQSGCDWLTLNNEVAEDLYVDLKLKSCPGNGH